MGAIVRARALKSFGNGKKNTGYYTPVKPISLPLFEQAHYPLASAVGLMEASQNAFGHSPQDVGPMIVKIGTLTGEKEDESRRSLLGRLVARAFVFTDSRTRTLFFGVCNMTDYMIGAGILGLTSTFMSGGWFIGTLMLAVFGLTTWLSIEMLMDAACATNRFSYEGLGNAVGGAGLQLVWPVCDEFTVFMHLL